MPVDQLRPLIHDVMIRGERVRNVAIEAVNRRGRPVRLQVSVLPLSADGSGSSGALILMDADEPA
jgi:two-component system CheB/CheR fusion protein